MAKRPRPQQLEKIVPEEPALDITNTMSLVVNVSGTEVRVKDTGIRRDEENSTKLTPQVGSISPPPNYPESLMNRLKFDDLLVTELLGHGSQGKVRKCRHKLTGDFFAVKSITFVEDKEAMLNTVVGELRRVHALKHPNIVTSYEAFFREGYKLYLVMDYMDCGTMSSLIKLHGAGFPQPMVSYVALGLVTGLQHLHASGVIHRDLKPANVLANSLGEVKISDFGVAKHFGDQSAVQTLAAVGSTPYMSPERLRSIPYSFSCDVWSCGLTIAECAIGRYPFGYLKNRLFDLCQAIESNQATVEWGSQEAHSLELRDFVEQCLRPAETRPTASQLLSHPFLVLGRSVTQPQAGEWFSSIAKKCENKN